MSVYYDVKEYLEIREIAGGNDPMVDLARKHLAWLGWKMLDDSASVRKISLSCGEKNYVFSGDTVCADFHDMTGFGRGLRLKSRNRHKIVDGLSLSLDRMGSPIRI